jgi:hypothetical protein
MTTRSSIFRSVSRLRLAVELGFEVDPESWWCQVYNAGAYADIDDLVELHEIHHMPYTEVVCRGATTSGRISKLQWLLDEQHCPEPADVDCSAVHAPTLGMLKYLKQRGWVFTADTCAAAATSDHAASVLQYLHSEGAPFDVRTITNAIPVQELPLLQWLCERGCNLSKVDPLAARPMGDLQTLSWLRSKGCPCDYNFLCEMAASSGCINTLQWVKDNGLIEWSSEVLSEYLNVAAVDGELDAAMVRTNNMCIRICTCICTLMIAATS